MNDSDSFAWQFLLAIWAMLLPWSVVVMLGVYLTEAAKAGRCECVEVTP